MTKSYLKQFFLLCLLLLCSSGKDMEKSTKDKITVFLIGDSTCAIKMPQARPETGWGEMFGLYFNPFIAVDNHAVNGQSTKTFIEEGRWTKILEKLKQGDYVFIQFGHNDAYQGNSSRFTNPEEFSSNLTKFVNETKQKGAYPVLLTSISRCTFNNDGKIIPAFEAYTSVTRKVSTDNNVPLIDMERKTASLLENIGVEKSHELYMSDNTHLTNKGAYAFAGLVVNGLEELPITDLVLEMNKTANQSLVIYDADGTNSNYIWYKNPTATATVQAPIVNPAPDEVNSTSYCAGFLRKRNTINYEGVGLTNLDIDISEYKTISFMVYKEISGRVQLELHDIDGNKYWLNQEYTTVGKWCKMNFEIPNTITKNIKTILIAPHNNSTDYDSYVDQMMYWDEVVIYREQLNTNIVEAEIEQNIVHSELYSIHGYLIKSFGHNEEIDLQNKYPQGIYILRKTDVNGKVSAKKITIK